MNIIKTIYYFLVCINLIFTSQVSDAKNNSLESTAHVMPQYTASFNVKGCKTENACLLILRFYQAFGDGSSTGWQSPVNLPVVTLNGKELSLFTYFSYMKHAILV
jgi:hypothetical protein